jgi:DEAD/DEAH box helicase domain-containing protein
VRARDGYRCQNCGTPEMNGRQHDIHHKVPFRAFVAHEHLREGLPAELAWQVANRLPNLVTLCTSCHRLAEVSVRTRSGLGGVAALLAGVAPLFLMCDPRDLGIVPEPQSPTTGLPTITVYEHTPGGVGYAEQLFISLPEILTAAHDLVNACPCENGCPACVGPVLEHEYMLDTKMLARALLAEMCVTQD